MIKATIDVRLGERSYPVYSGFGMSSLLAPTMVHHQLSKQIFIVTDSNVAVHYLKPLEKHLHHFGFVPSSIIIPPGEIQKTLRGANALYTKMIEEGVGRTSAILALGGGVIGDLAGFVAATYHRGLNLVHVPTTLLAQVDSSVGGKVAVNHPLGKNLIGVFHQPKFVWSDAEYLRTLPKREVVCGLGEIVKYGILGDAELFASVESNLPKILAVDLETISMIQVRCLQIKSSIVSQDERETGLRMVLNTGHTIGHALEAAGKYRQLKHGEAVLLGLIAESFIAAKLGMLDDDTHGRIVRLIRQIPFNHRMTGVTMTEIKRALGRDKKAVSRKNRFILPERLGEVVPVEDVDEKLISDALKHLKKNND
jgi:3-dehydroquinate synthase